MLQEAGTHLLRELRILVCHSPFFMPAPFFPDSHKQWLAKGVHLGSWGNAATLKHNAFIVFQIEKRTCMLLFNGVECRCCGFRCLTRRCHSFCVFVFASRAVPHISSHPVGTQLG